MTKKWMPLLQEYFYDDWERIRMIFSDDNASVNEQIVLVTRIAGSELFPGNEEAMEESITDKVNVNITSGAIRKIYQQS